MVCMTMSFSMNVDAALGEVANTGRCLQRILVGGYQEHDDADERPR